MEKISIIIPLYNEEENIEILFNEIKEALFDLNWELILINDGSIDNTWDKIKNIKNENKNIKGINFRKNFGQTQALSAGINISTGKYIVTMDGDLQNDPKDIPLLLSEIQKGYDLVSGYRKERKDKYFSRILPSKIANFFISKITKIKLNDYGCALKIYNAQMLKEIDLFGEMHRFLPALIGYKGGKILEIPVNHRERIKGNSKYGLNRIFKVTFDILIVKFMGDFILKPGYFFATISLILFIISFSFALITLYYKWYHNVYIKDQPLFLVSIFLSLVAVQIGLIGLIAEILLKIYRISSKKPAYETKEII